MTKLRIVLAILALAVIHPASSQAGMILSVSAPGTDLDALRAGDTVTFQAVLSGLAPGDRLDYLAAMVSFSGSIFDPLVVSPGAIVPEVDGFIGSTFSNAVDGNYDTLFAPLGTPITGDGIFFSFDLTVRGPGRGSVAIDFVDGFGTDQAGNPLAPPSASAPLEVNSPGVNAVPEPSSMVLMLFGGGTAFAYARLRKRPPT